METEGLKATGQMAQRIRQFDWAATPMGPMAQWPTWLTTALNLILDSPVPMVLICGQELLTLQNDAYQTMLNPSPETLGRSFLEAWSPIKDIIEPQILDAFAGKSVRIARQPFNFNDGKGGIERRYFDYSFSPVRDHQGHVAAILHTGTEITARERAYHALKESEARLRTVIDGVPQLIWRSEPGGHWIWASPQWEEQTGLTIKESLGRGWLQAICPADRDAVVQCWDEAAHVLRLEVEARIYASATQDYRWFQLRATPVRNAAGEVVEWLGTSTDIHDLRQLQTRQSALVGELQHRTRNLITVVKAIASRTLERSNDLEEFQSRFGERLGALSRVQGLLSNLSAGQRVTFGELLHSELAALAVSDDRISLDGPDGIELRSATVQTFALALHELVTNASKHGAFASERGRLRVAWQVVEDHGEYRLHVDWRETGVPVSPHKGSQTSTGYGRTFIEQALRYQLDAKTTFELASDGLHCTIEMKVPNLRD